MRRTKALVKLASALVADPDSRVYGYPLSRETGIRSGVLYPLLSRLLAEGWLSDGWEDIDIATISAGRPRRRYYMITSAGRVALENIAEGA